MLEQIDLSQKLTREYHKEAMPGLDIRLGALQRRAIESNLPVIIVYEGWEAAGKGTMINRMIRALDRRHFKVYSIDDPTEEERLRPYLWRFWTRTPPRGQMSIFDRSWYGRVLHDRVNKAVGKREWLSAYDEINGFERQLTVDGCVIIKLFLHISKREQKKRYVKLESNPSTSWRITRRDWIHHKKYEKYKKAAENMFERTGGSGVPWNVIAAENRRFATAKIIETVCEALEKAMDANNGSRVASGEITRPTSFEEAGSKVPHSIDLTKSISRDDYNERVDRYQTRLRNLEHEIYIKRIPVIIVYEGWDAAGKGGNIKRLTQSLDPRGYEVVPIGAPNDVEKRHHYLWRFWKAMPKAGHVTIFDRSWYGRVLVERVEELCSEAEWRRAYQEINEMEAQLVDFGAVLLKFWLHIDKDEQIRRFKERESIPHKRWKITEEDWRNREKWDQYHSAIKEMLARTDTPVAPWTIVESNSKHYARLKTLKTLIKAINAKL